MACNCRNNRGNCGFEEVVSAASRNGSCSRRMETMDNFTDIFASETRDVGPYTWNGYVWYEVEVEFTGPYYGGFTTANNGNRAGENGCGRRNGNGCGCNCNCGC